MASALPHQPPVDHTPRTETNVSVTRDDPTDVLQALTSETAQQILVALQDQPATVSDVANATGTSLQTAAYHLEQLCDAALVTPVGQWYSEKGNEMTVYALATEQLVIELGTTEVSG